MNSILSLENSMTRNTLVSVFAALIISAVTANAQSDPQTAGTSLSFLRSGEVTIQVLPVSVESLGVADIMEEETKNLPVVVGLSQGCKILSLGDEESRYYLTFVCENAPKLVRVLTGSKSLNSSVGVPLMETLALTGSLVGSGYDTTKHMRPINIVLTVQGTEVVLQATKMPKGGDFRRSK